MLKKNWVFHVSTFAILFLFMACGSKPIAIELFSPEGRWEVVSIDGKSVSEYFALFGGDSADIETTIVQNDFDFFPNGSWFWTLGLNIEADMGGALKLEADMSLASKGSYSGSYTPRGGSMVIVHEKLTIQLEPEDFWASHGVTEADFKDEITKSWLFDKVEDWSARVTGPRLTLTNSDGMEQVLRRK